MKVIYLLNIKDKKVRELPISIEELHKLKEKDPI